MNSQEIEMEDFHKGELNLHRINYVSTGPKSEGGCNY
jgi:hypothetical protein